MLIIIITVIMKIMILPPLIIIIITEIGKGTKKRTNKNIALLTCRLRNHPLSGKDEKVEDCLSERGCW